jgi:hypothetical protein
MNRLALALAVSITVPSFSFAQDAAAPDPNAAGFALTIYSTADPATFDPQELARQRLMNPYAQWQIQLPGYGVVREVRKVDIKAGDNIVRFTDVASGIDPTTVTFESLTDPAGTSVLEQNYEYDVVSGTKLLEKYLGKDVVVVTRGSGNAGTETHEGSLLSSDPSSIVLKTKDGVRVVNRNDVTTVALADAANLITKPTLVWNLSSEKAGAHDAKVTYQTDGLTWRADYSVVMNKDDSAADVGAWVSILNESGASYPNAKLKLVAGDVQRVKAQQQVHLMETGRFAAKAVRDEFGFQEKSFFEYHLYTLGRTTSLGDNSTKQIELFPTRQNVPAKKTYVYYGLPEQFRLWIAPEPTQDRNLGTESNKKVDIYLQIENKEANGLGIPLPAGRIRAYKKDDADGSLEFVGEDVIQHTPKDEKVLVKLGSAFDVVGERVQTDFRIDERAHVIEEEFEIKLRNHKKEPVDVIVKENLFRWTNWEIINSSDKYEKQDYRTIHIPVKVEPDGEKKMTYRVKYTW